MASRTHRAWGRRGDIATTDDAFQSWAKVFPAVAGQRRQRKVLGTAGGMFQMKERRQKLALASGRPKPEDHTMHGSGCVGCSAGAGAVAVISWSALAPSRAC